MYAIEAFERVKSIDEIINRLQKQIEKGIDTIECEELISDYIEERSSLYDALCNTKLNFDQ